jgi:hypothetical protein
MALRFLADHCVSNFTVQILRNAGHEVLCLREVLPVESPDAVVFQKLRNAMPYWSLSTATLLTS